MPRKQAPPTPHGPTSIEPRRIGDSAGTVPRSYPDIDPHLWETMALRCVITNLKYGVDLSDPAARAERGGLVGSIEDEATRLRFYFDILGDPTDLMLKVEWGLSGDYRTYDLLSLVHEARSYFAGPTRAEWDTTYPATHTRRPDQIRLEQHPLHYGVVYEICFTKQAAPFNPNPDKHHRYFVLRLDDGVLTHISLPIGQGRATHMIEGGRDTDHILIWMRGSYRDYARTMVWYGWSRCRVDMGKSTYEPAARRLR